MALEEHGTAERLSADDLREAWPLLAPEDRRLGFGELPRAEAEDFFLSLPARDQLDLVLALPPEERRSWMRLLPPDDAADVVQAAPAERDGLLALLDDTTRREVTGLLAYAEDEAGGLMNPRFARLRPDATVDEAIIYLRRQARLRDAEAIYYAYVIDEDQRLLGVVGFRDLFAAAPTARIREVMRTDVVSVSEDMDQEAVSRVFAESDLPAIPVVDAQGRIKGIVTVDDIVDVVEEEATEDIQKIGGVEALGAPYLEVGLAAMVRKRGGWLAALFIGEMLTATAMTFFEKYIARAVVLAVFLPLIISSGGNSGSQASTLIIRAMALGEVRLRDWWRVAGRELMTGFSLGAVLGAIGFVRVVAWERIGHVYGEHYLLIAATVSASLLGVVMLGTLAGSLLPFVLRRLGLDPASASAPFVATLVDVAGVVIYFVAASLILSGSLL